MVWSITRGGRGRQVAHPWKVWRKIWKEVGKGGKREGRGKKRRKEKREKRAREKGEMEWKRREIVKGEEKTENGRGKV